MPLQLGTRCPRLTEPIVLLNMENRKVSLYRDLPVKTQVIQMEKNLYNSDYPDGPGLPIGQEINLITSTIGM